MASRRGSRFNSTPGQLRQNWRRREHEANQLYEAEMREFIARKTREGSTIKQLSATLQVPPRIVKSFLQRSLKRVQELRMANIDPKEAHQKLLPPEDATYQRQRVKKGPGAGTHRRTSTKIVSIKSSPKLLSLHKQAWDLRKRAMPYDEIARMLRITEQEARQAVLRRANELDALELESAEEARVIMVAQIDDMIKAIMPDATGITYLGQPVQVAYEAIDRMVKLMDAKAKLLGLNKANKIDLTIRLKEFASQAGYEYADVEEVAAEVVQAMSQRRNT